MFTDSVEGQTGPVPGVAPVRALRQRPMARVEGRLSDVSHLGECCGEPGESVHLGTFLPNAAGLTGAGRVGTLPLGCPPEQGHRGQQLLGAARVETVKRLSQGRAGCREAARVGKRGCGFQGHP